VIETGKQLFTKTKCNLWVVH